MCNGFNNKIASDCKFFVESNIAIVCSHESNIRSGIPLDEDAILKKFYERLKRINEMQGNTKE